MRVVVRIISIFFFVSLLWNSHSQQNVKQKSTELSTLVTKKVYNFTPQNKIYPGVNSLSSGISGSIQMRSVYKFDHLALFCKIEEKVARKSNLHMRLRLGSLDYVNYLEQKPLTVSNN